MSTCACLLLARGRYHRDTLVLYLYAETDPEYKQNLEFFVREAVRGDARCEYAILVMNKVCPAVVQQHDLGGVSGLSRALFGGMFRLGYSCHHSFTSMNRSKHGMSAQAC